jgi:hypothetical protein
MNKNRLRNHKDKSDNTVKGVFVTKRTKQRLSILLVRSMCWTPGAAMPNAVMGEKFNIYMN